MFKDVSTEQFVLASIVRELLSEPGLVVLGTNKTSHFISKVNTLSINPISWLLNSRSQIRIF